MMNPAWFNPKPIAPLTDTAQETELTDGSPGQVVGGKMQMGKSFQAAKVDPSAQMWATLSKAAKDAQKITFESKALYDGIPQAKGEEVNRKALMRKDKAIVEPIFATLAEDYATTEGEKTLEFTNPETKEVEKITYDMTNQRSRVDYARARYEAAVEGLEVKSPEYQKRMLLEAAAQGDPSEAKAFLSSLPNGAWDKLEKEIVESIGNIPDQELQTQFNQLIERQDIGLEQSIAEGNREKFEVAVTRMVNFEYGAMKDMLISLGKENTDAGSKARDFTKFLTDEGLLTPDVAKEMDIESLFQHGTSARKQADMLKQILVKFAGFQSAQDDSNLSQDLVESILQTTLTRGSAYTELARANREKILIEREANRRTDLADIRSQLDANPEDASVILRGAPTKSVFETDPKDGNLISGGGLDVLITALQATPRVNGPQDTITGDAIRSTTSAMFNSRWSSGNVDMSQGQDNFMATSNTAPLSSGFADVLRGKNKDYVTKLSDQSYVLTAEGQSYVWGQFVSTEKTVRRSSEVQNQLRQTFMAKINSTPSPLDSAEQRYQGTIKTIGQYVRAATGAKTSDKDIAAVVGASGEFEAGDLPPELRSLTVETTRFIKSTIKQAESDRKVKINLPSASSVVSENGLRSDLVKINEPVHQPEAVDNAARRNLISKDELRWQEQTKVFFKTVDAELKLLQDVAAQSIAMTDVESPRIATTVAELSEKYMGLPDLRRQLKEYEDSGNDEAAANLRDHIKGKELVAQSYYSAYRARAELQNRYVIPFNEADNHLWGGQKISWAMIDDPSSPLEDFATTRAEEIFDPATNLFSVDFVTSVYGYIVESAEISRGGSEKAQNETGNQERFEEFQKVIGNLYSIVLNEMEGEGITEKGSKALMGLAFIGAQLDRLNTKPDGGTINFTLPDGHNMVIPTFQEGAYLLAQLQASEGQNEATSPFGMYALMRLGRNVIANQGQENGIEEATNAWTGLWKKEFATFISGTTVSATDGNMPPADIHSDESYGIERMERPSVALNDARVSQRDNNFSQASRDIGDALGVAGARDTLYGQTPSNAIEIHNATMAAGGEGRGISPITGLEVDPKTLGKHFREVQKAVDAQYKAFKDLGIEVPVFNIDEETATKPEEMEQKDWDRILKLNGKNIIEAMLVAGDLEYVQTQIGDQDTGFFSDFHIFGFIGTDQTGFTMGTDGLDPEGNRVFNMSHYPAAMRDAKSSFNTQFQSMQGDFHVGLNTANPNGLIRAIAGLRRWNMQSEESMSLGQTMEMLNKMRHHQNGPYGNINRRKIRVNDNGNFLERNLNAGYAQHPPTTNSPISFGGEVVMNQNEVSAVSVLLHAPFSRVRERFVNEVFGPSHKENPGWSDFVATATKPNVTTQKVLKLAQVHLKINDLQLDLDPTTNTNVRFGMTSEEKRQLTKETYTPRLDYKDTDKDGNIKLKWGPTTITTLPPYMFPKGEARAAARGLTEAFVQWDRDWQFNGWPMFNNPVLTPPPMPGKRPVYINQTAFKDVPTDYTESRKSWYSIFTPDRGRILRVPRDFSYGDLRNVQGVMRAQSDGGVAAEEESIAKAEKKAKARRDEEEALARAENKRKAN